MPANELPRPQQTHQPLDTQQTGYKHVYIEKTINSWCAYLTNSSERNLGIPLIRGGLSPTQVIKPIILHTFLNNIHLIVNGSMNTFIHPQHDSV